ncbi:MAG TPA: histidine kinase, partial [Steroidobacteraceae bacterium]|nr:histidine kinase [Steroidobacteraceae bacterium]
MSDESSQPYPLQGALPTEFKAGPYGAPVYPVFSRQWLWRRSWIAVPYAVFFGALMALGAWEKTSDWAFFVSYAARTTVVWTTIFLLGISLATCIRQLQLSPNGERSALPSAILVNIVVGFYGVNWYEQFYRAELLIRGMGDVSQQAGVRDIVYRSSIVAVVLLASGLLSVITYFVELQRWRVYVTKIELRRTRAQRDLADSQLTVLQAQVEPHFLYNTMASVRSLIRDEPARAEATIDALVDHLRATLPKIREGSTSSAKLSDQLEICRSYLDVMRVRMGSRFRYTIDAPTELGRLSFPPLMLISLVENAIKHGVERKPGACFIAIRVQRLMTSAGEMI